ncbi:P-loop containing nucleoside triphosphate hydrolase protein [Xylariaceae sp. FL0594]|nr:P-loop containing nucleoside triphosphate hydrolase protein [Xylariaceae sp. FL0594]
MASSQDTIFHHLPVPDLPQATTVNGGSPGGISSLGVQGMGGDKTSDAWFDQASAKRINTDVVIAQSLKSQYPGLQLTIATPDNGLSLLRYAEAGHATYRVIVEDHTKIPARPGSSNSSSTTNANADNDRSSSNSSSDESGVAAGQGADGISVTAAGVYSPATWTIYFPPPRRIDGDPGRLAEQVNFGKFEYKWQGHEFLLYLADGRDGTQPYGVTRNHYILSPSQKSVRDLLLAAGSWANELHGEVWVFDSGYWQKSAELFRSILGAEWDSVILDADMKKAIIDDHQSFFDSREAYARLKVPWKRGVIYYGPPGNGKTISIKATMHMLYDRKPPVPTLYVRSLVAYGGPERALALIFGKARQFAPCYLVFEDLDSIISDNVRSYFLNEVDGLKANDGIFMIGSTNHLDRLDPGISKRPSRFDRKYYFPDPNLEQRVAYCRYWQRKLSDNKDIEFPDKLCDAIAKITDKFSFAYMQEAFVAALLAIARRSTTGMSCAESMREYGDAQDGNNVVGDDDDCWVDVGQGVHDRGEDDDDLDDLVLWVEIKKQIKLLRQGLKGDDGKGTVTDIRGRTTTVSASSSSSAGFAERAREFLLACDVRDSYGRPSFGCAEYSSSAMVRAAAARAGRRVELERAGDDRYRARWA